MFLKPFFTFKRLAALITVAFAFASTPAGADPPELIVKRSAITGHATFVTAKNGGAISAPGAARTRLNAPAFIQHHGRLFGIVDGANQLALQTNVADHLAQTHTTYHQLHKGVPVFSGVFKLHSNALGHVTAANGRIYSINPKLPVEPTLTPQQAFKFASMNFESQNPVLHQSTLVIVDPGWYGDPPMGERLAYHIIISDEELGLLQAFLVEAHAGKLLDQWSLTHTARQREVYDGVAERALPGVLARIEGDPPALKVPDDVNAAYDYLGDAYDYFFRGFGRDSVDDLGLKLIATVNSRALGCPNAQWRSSILQTLYCDQSVSDDVIAHEVAHGLTYFTADLIYQNQSGQLNESFSDVFGELIDIFNGDAAFASPPGSPLIGPPWPLHETGPGADLPNNLRGSECTNSPDFIDGVRWLVAEDALGFGGAIRDMWMPACQNDPDGANSPLQLCDQFDSGGVHSGSGIPNHAFAMLTDGKDFNGYSIRGIGPIKSGAVWYRALTTYLTMSSDFRDAYDSFNQSARDLVGSFPADPRTGLPSESMFTSDDALQVDLALRAVEMDTPGRCGKTTPILHPDAPPYCVNRRRIFFDDVESRSTGWAVQNSNPLTPYNWTRTANPLPFNRAGVAWFCDDPDLGNCDDKDESGVHSLLSPPILLPQGLRHLRLQFTHFLATEGGWDGGSVAVRTNDGPWQPVTAAHCIHNPYNSQLLRNAQGPNNPLAGTAAWTGVGGKFGTSLLDLSGFARSGDLIQIRFDFGKDGCAGVTGWFVDDVELFDCVDCDRNDRGDDRDLHYSTIVGPAGPVGKNTPLTMTLSAGPPASAPVQLTIIATGDLGVGGDDEYLDVYLNGTLLGRIFEGSGTDCPNVADVAELTIDPLIFNAAIENGPANFTFIANDVVDPRLCDGTSYVRLRLSYRTAAADEDDSLVQDVCENCRIPAAPLATAITTTNRYLLFHPPDPGRLTAIVVEIPASASAPKRRFWLGQPFTQVEPAGDPAHYAAIQCDPFFYDWGSLGEIRALGPSIMPGVDFKIYALDVGCVPPAGPPDPNRGVDFNSQLSAPLHIATTAVRGDLVGKNGSPVPDGRADVLDLAAIIDRVAGKSDAIPLPVADLAPLVPDQNVDMRDVSWVLDAMIAAQPAVAPEPCAFTIP